MSILIKDTAMPKNCFDCPCQDHHTGFCNITNKYSYDDRPADCPLIKVSNEAIEVVRCKDCRYKQSEECALDVEKFKPEDDDYCSWGREKASRYIDAGVLIDALNGEQEECTLEHISLGKAKRILKDSPFADVRENVHGEWKYINQSVCNAVFCSVCNYSMGANMGFNFCPNYGGDMRGGE